jgi:hypothetical protein
MNATLPDLGGSKAFDQAKLTQWLWKTESMMTMALAIAELALTLDEIAADDLPESMEHGGQGIAGSVFAELVRQKVLVRKGIWQGNQFFGKQRVSHRDGRKAAKINVYTVDTIRATAFLRGKHRFKELHQAELIAA